MTSALHRECYFIGWDVGGWHCEQNANSRDAIVILDNNLGIVGEPWRGNLRLSINSNSTTAGWLDDLLTMCGSKRPHDSASYTMAIDTPLGFSEEFRDLVTTLKHVDVDDVSGLNRYLFRHTERHLFDRGLKPLSPIKDMIGSQATKGMHVLAKFAPHVESCGVWCDGDGFRAIETYPSACRSAKVIKSLRKGQKRLDNDDVDDARTCALMAYLFAMEREKLEPPPETVSTQEGWIWVPREP